MKNISSLQLPLSRPRGAVAAATSASGLPAGLCAVQLVLAYEWLVSGINKLLNPNFTAQLAGQLRQNLDGNPYSWYAGIFRQLVVPHAGFFGVLTEITETSIGIALLISAVLWLWRPQAPAAIRAGRVACLALAAAAFLPFNFFLMSGDPLPWIDPANAFNEGVSIDALIPLLAVVLLLANLRAGRRVSRALRLRGTELTLGVSRAS